MAKKIKYEKPLNVDMDFDEMMQRISKVDKDKVETSIKKKSSMKKNRGK
jgi:hypothetical protein